MSLRGKTLVTVGATLLSLIACLALATRILLLNRFEALETSLVRKTVERAVNSLNIEIRQLAETTSDYAIWDATYDFMDSRDPRYLSADFVTASMSVRVDAALLLSNQGEVVHSRWLGPTSRSGEALLAELIARVRARAAATGKGFQGVVALRAGAMLVAGRPILMSNRTGASRGTLVFGRSVDDAFVSDLTASNLSMIGLTPFEPAASGALEGVQKQILSSLLPVVHPLDWNTVEGIALVRDLEGQPALVMTTRSPRWLMLEGRRGIAYLAAFMITVGLVFSIVPIVLLETQVLRRLENLSRNAREIALQADSSARLPVSGADELAELALAGNAMLSSLHSSRQQLRESQARLRDVIDHSSNLFFARAPEGQMLYLSPQARQFLGREPEEVRLWDEIVSDDPRNEKGAIQAKRATQTGERQPVYELELGRKDGSRLWVEVNEAPVVREDGTMMLVGALKDVSGHKRAEAENARLEESLRQSQKMEAIGRLAGGVAHDFNNILNVIVGYGELAQREVPPDSKLARRLAEIVKAAHRAAGLTRQLLAFSRKQVLQPRVVELNAVVSAMEPMLRRLISAEIEIEMVLDPEAGAVEIDPIQIDQVILNLGVNAGDAMPHGGRLVVSTSHAEAFRPDGQRESWAILTVRDSGIGMDEEVRSHIFEPFFTTKEVGKGTGLGLATVHGIVTQSGGRIEVDSAPSQGTSFRVAFPQTKLAATHRVVAAPAPTRGAGKVLLVEDQEGVRNLAREVLVEAGYQVLVAADPKAALALIEERDPAPDILITDVVLPGMSGPELADRLRERLPHLRVLFMSGYSAQHLGQHGIVDRRIKLLHKPFAPDQLVHAVQRALDGSWPPMMLEKVSQPGATEVLASA